MDKLDKKLLSILQTDFPITAQPYHELGKKLGITPQEVLSRIADLKEQGIIRRLGGIFDSRKLGYKSTLCAMKVPEEKIAQTAEIINSYPGVTHNYLRENEYNMWFTLIAPSKAHIQKICREIKERSGIHDLIELPAKDFFKIDVKFSIEGGSQ
ncbi:MAG: AsnC family transcriptional regulator [Bacillota bacterium]